MKRLVLVLGLLACVSAAHAGYSMRCESAKTWSAGPFDTASECTDYVGRLRNSCSDVAGTIAGISSNAGRDIVRQSLPDLCRERGYDCGCWEDHR
jgi:hypothetical protein